ncbi:hypothetical protein O181_005309 [Austropuccinia psidii MF-1]|uniref:Uncharacterized protein n=1 Tax=Austropuccinia psidii MF-1 TaxID=1389203 RepID=A0A9Q3GFR7_9BASI|nr:hypothetical protein [Austropuccinia psidii MF-1]
MSSSYPGRGNFGEHDPLHRGSELGGSAQISSPLEPFATSSVESLFETITPCSPSTASNSDGRDHCTPHSDAYVHEFQVSCSATQDICKGPKEHMQTLDTAGSGGNSPKASPSSPKALQSRRIETANGDQFCGLQGFHPYANPEKSFSCIESLPNSYDSSNRPVKMRKRTIALKPKHPKYAGLTNFAAPADLLSEILPFNFGQRGKAIKSSPLDMLSFPLLGTKISKQGFLNKKVIPEAPPKSSSDVPIDFLKYLPEQEWTQRRDDLQKMVEERKEIFLSKGFSESNGKPFEPNEPAIEKKPVPNRWVWYMRLSTDYDKLKNTQVPSGGPAGYLKYGWDRLGNAGKQPYQELADIYSSERCKFMAEHGITEETLKKPKSKQPQQARSVGNSLQGLAMNTSTPHNLLSNQGSLASGRTLALSTETEALTPYALANFSANCFGGPTLQASSSDSVHNEVLPPGQSSPLSNENDETGRAFRTAENPHISSYANSPEYTTTLTTPISPFNWPSTKPQAVDLTDSLGPSMMFYSSPSSYIWASSPNTAYSMPPSMDYSLWPVVFSDSVGSIGCENFSMGTLCFNQDVDAPVLDNQYSPISFGDTQTFRNWPISDMPFKNHSLLDSDLAYF